jgi:probable phosphoglycerate mutase
MESAEILAAVLDREVEVEPGFAEMEFGAWDGLTFAEVGERHGEELTAWLGSLDVAPGGSGESFREVEKRVLDALARVLERHAGKTVVLVSHVTPIKTIVAHALDAPLQSVFRMELTPASITVVSWYDGRPSMRMFNALPPGNDVFAAGASRW